MSIKNLQTPLSEQDIDGLEIGDIIYLSGYIFCGRDAVLPKIVKMTEIGTESQLGIELKGGVIFHTAVSPAGVGPTSSNKLEIEASITPLSKAGIKLHLGKGMLHPETIESLNTYHSVYAVIPPVTALLGQLTTEQKIVAFPEEGMEAFHMLKVERYPAIIAAAHGRSIYDEQ